MVKTAAVIAGMLLVPFAAGCGGSKQVVAAIKADPESARAAEADVSATLPSVALYFADHATYAGMTVDALRTYDPGLSPTVSLHDLGATSFCVESTVRDATASATGPPGQVVDTPCP